MLLKYYKGQPNFHVIRYKKGRVLTQGGGLEFWYLPFNTSIAVVPTISQDVSFIFHEATANFQQVAIQGLLSYRIPGPAEVALELMLKLHQDNNKSLKKKK